MFPALQQAESPASEGRRPGRVPRQVEETSQTKVHPERRRGGRDAAPASQGRGGRGQREGEELTAAATTATTRRDCRLGPARRRRRHNTRFPESLSFGSRPSFARGRGDGGELPGRPWRNGGPLDVEIVRATAGGFAGDGSKVRTFVSGRQYAASPSCAVRCPCLVSVVCRFFASCSLALPLQNL